MCYYFQMGFSVKTLKDVGLAQSLPLNNLFHEFLTKNITEIKCHIPPNRAHHVVDIKKVKPKTF